MKTSQKDGIILGLIVLLHLLILFLFLNFRASQKTVEPVILADLVNPPKKPLPPTKQPEPEKKEPTPRAVTIAPAKQSAMTKQAEKQAAISQNKSMPDSLSKTDHQVATQSTQTSAQAAPFSSAPSTTPIGTDGGEIQLNQLIMIYRPDTEVFYPRRSKEIGEQGVVVIEMSIDEKGSVKKVRVLDSSGYPRLDKAAQDLTLSVRFSPYQIGGVPSPIKTNISIFFRLPN